jgi:hypothetical protein
MPRAFQICPQASGRLRIDGKRIAPAALADDAQRSVAMVLVQVADREGGDFRAAQTDLQANRQNCAVAQAFECLGVRQVEQLARILLREGKRGAFVAVDRRPHDFRHRVL